MGGESLEAAIGEAVVWEATVWEAVVREAIVWEAVVREAIVREGIAWKAIISPGRPSRVFRNTPKPEQPKCKRRACVAQFLRKKAPTKCACGFHNF